MSDTRSRARIAILSHLAEFSLLRRIGAQTYSGLEHHAFHGGVFTDKDVQPGDLVALQSAPASKWYLGWILERERPANWVCDRFLIESIEDGSLCWWHNVGLVYYNRETVKSHPEWRWSDRQWQFKDRWWRVCYKDLDAYMHLPCYPTFDGETVELAVRVRHGFSPTVIRKTFPCWPKTTKAMMREFYTKASAKLAAEKLTA